jgi:acyl-CoA synthetase (AMP-forming)/AMP-acid ligase II
MNNNYILSGGENISSIEVEAHLLTHRMVDEAAVIAVPDEKWGEVPSAFITLRNNADTPIDGTYVRTFLSVCLYTCMHMHAHMHRLSVDIALACTVVIDEEGRIQTESDYHIKCVSVMRHIFHVCNNQ